MPFGTEKLEWCGYPTVKFFFNDTIIRFDRMHERDRHTHRHRMTVTGAFAQHRAAKITPTLLYHNIDFLQM